MDNVIKIEFNGVELGSIVRSTYHSSGIGFFSEENDGLQLGYMNRPDHYVIAPHTHNKIKREAIKRYNRMGYGKITIENPVLSSESQKKILEDLFYMLFNNNIYFCT